MPLVPGTLAPPSMYKRYPLVIGEIYNNNQSSYSVNIQKVGSVDSFMKDFKQISKLTFKCEMLRKDTLTETKKCSI